MSRPSLPTAAARSCLLALLGTVGTLAACSLQPPAAIEAAADGGAPATRGAAGALAAGALDPETAALARSVIDTSCLTCHDQLMLRQQRLTPKQWRAVIEKMHRWGAPLGPRELDALVAFASATYHPGAGQHRAPALRAAEVDAQLAPLPDGPFAAGDAAAGAVLFARFCAACHGQDATGSPLALNLVDRPILYRAPELAAVVRSGRGRMPWFALTDTQVGSILAHLRALPAVAATPADPAPATP